MKIEAGRNMWSTHVAIGSSLGIFVAGCTVNVKAQLILANKSLATRE